MQDSDYGHLKETLKQKAVKRLKEIQMTKSVEEIREELRPKIPTCASCPFWKPNPDLGTDMGECHKEPPILVGLDTQFPPIGDWEWCGDHPRFVSYADQFMRATHDAPGKAL